ncbi:MAG: hypothetical protein DME20_01505, partial [Verrucomicrobia bacterium]
DQPPFARRSRGSITLLGSARVPRAGESRLGFADFSHCFQILSAIGVNRKVRFGATPNPARETRALPRFSFRARSGCRSY